MTRPPPLAWRAGTVVAAAWETPRARTVVLDVPGWPGHRAGQHVDVRLTADDGYQAQRSYSIASAPGAAGLALTVDRLEDGEVSPWLTDELQVGDALELRGPIGAHFVWDVSAGGPLLLVGGGSGVVPLMAMLRHRAAALRDADDDARHRVPVRLLYSSRRREEIIYRDELAALAHADPGVEVTVTLTREQPAGWGGPRRRIDRELLAAVAWPPARRPHVFVCGSHPLVEAVATALVELGHEPGRIRTERFGPSGEPTAPTARSSPSAADARAPA